jgi:hypothetical protein
MAAFAQETSARRGANTARLYSASAGTGIVVDVGGDAVAAGKCLQRLPRRRVPALRHGVPFDGGDQGSPLKVRGTPARGLGSAL